MQFACISGHRRLEFAMESADCLTLVMPLQARSGLTTDDFYEYWLNAHVTLPARFPGISSIFLHSTSFDDVAWPRLDGVSHRPPPEDDFWGVPEATFVTLEGLADFQAASKVQMDDGINFLQEMIAYRSIADATQTAADRTGLPAPDGHDRLLRHLLFLRRRDGVATADFRRFVAEVLVPAWAASDEVLKVRRHLFEEVEVTLDHPGVRMSQAAGPAVPGRGRDRAARRGRPGTVRRLAGLAAARRGSRRALLGRPRRPRQPVHHHQVPGHHHARRGPGGGRRRRHPAAGRR
jgi:hypothetical protein